MVTLTEFLNCCVWLVAKVFDRVALDIGQRGSGHLDLHLPLHPVPPFTIGETEARGLCRPPCTTRVTLKAQLGCPR